MHRQKHSEPSSVPLLEASLEHWIYLFVVHAVCVWHECRLKIISTINLGLIWRISSYHRLSSCRYFLIPPLTEISRRLKVKKKKFPTEKIPAKYNIYIYIYLFNLEKVLFWISFRNRISPFSLLLEFSSKLDLWKLLISIDRIFSRNDSRWKRRGRRWSVTIRRFDQVWNDFHFSTSRLFERPPFRCRLRD